MTGLGRGRWVSRGGVLRWQRAARRTPSTPPLPPVSCGTEQGYQRHRYLARKGADGAVWPLPVDDPCGCRAAHAAHNWPPAEVRAEAC